MKNKDFFKDIKIVGFDFDDTLVDEKYYHASMREKELLLPGVLELLNLLREKKIIVGIITDGDQSYQEDRIKRAGIYDFLNFVYYGHGKKEEKPAKGILEDCFLRFDAKSPDEFLYVGDSYESDVSGMLFFGVKVCWITKEKGMPKEKNLIKVKNLGELLTEFKKIYG